MNFFPHLWHWIEIHTGTINESGPYYGFWSGFGSDIGEVALLGGLIAIYHHHNCHDPKCHRIGRPVPGTPYVACHKHHPAHENDGRATTAADMKTAYEARRK